MAYSRSRMAMAKQSGKSKAKVKSAGMKPKSKTMDKPGASVVKHHTSARGGGSRSRERRLMGRSL